MCFNAKNMKSLSAELEKIQEAYAEELTKFIHMLENPAEAGLPQAPGVTRISSKIYTVKLSCLGSCWQPDYYLADKQYSSLAKILKGSQSVRSLVKKLRNLIKTSGHYKITEGGSISYTSRRNERAWYEEFCRVNPYFLKVILELLDERTFCDE